MRIGRWRVAAGAAMVLTALLVAGCGKDKPEGLVASAKESLAKKERNAAVIQLKNALQKNPDLAEARFLLGKTLLETGDLPAAEKELRRAFELKYPPDQVVPPLARVMAYRGDYKKVIDEFGNVEIADPEGRADLQTTLGEASTAVGDADAARSRFAAALTAQPGFPRALLGEARLKAGTGDLAGAAAQVEAALAKSPSLVEAWQLKGDIAGTQGQFDGALAAYRKALEVRNDYVPAHAQIISTLLRQGRQDDARMQLDAMKKVAPKNLQTLYFQALLDFQERKYVAARTAIQQFLGMAPDNLLALALDGNIEYQLGAYAQAEASLLKVLQRVPKQRYARGMLVNTYLRSGQPTKALEALKPMLDERAADSGVLALAGEVQVQLGNMTEAARYFEKAAALDPKNTGKRAVAALSHVAMGDTEKGFRELEAAAAADTGTRADMALILANIQAKKFDAALAAIAALEKKQPDKPLSHNLRGAVLIAKGDARGARTSFERALALAPNDFAATANLARLDIADGKTADAQKRFEALLAKDPKNVRALLAMAELRVQAGGSAEEVATMIGKAVAADPTDVPARLALIGHYLRSKDPKNAVAAAQDALAVLPDNAEILAAAAQALQAAGETNQAISTWNKLASLQPGSPTPYLGEAETQFAAKNYDAALQSLRKALAIKPDLVEAQRALVQVYLKTGNSKEALVVARDVQRQRPKEYSGYALESDIHASKKAWSEAIAVCRAGLKQTDSTELAARLESALRASGNDAEASKFAATWLQDHPKDLAFRGRVAQVAMSRKDFAGAAREYKLILEAQPENVVVLNNLAWLSGQLKDPRALEYAEKAATLAPNNPAVLDTLGMLLVEKGDTKRGIELVRKAVNLAPNASGIRLNLARALVKDGQKDAAKKELEVLAKLGDKFPAQAEVATMLKEL